MGIRFYCPNGHKLHVKEFQAGRRGICPYCGVDVDIPLTSTRGSSKGKSSHKHSEEDVVNLNAIEPGAAPDAFSGASFTEAKQDNEIELSAPLDHPVDIPEPTPVSNASQTDPFEEAPKALWYVRPAAGGQYGPASADIMKTWLGEGRISADSMVWREGWSDWKNASDVFVQIMPNKIDLHLSGVINKKKDKKESVSHHQNQTSHSPHEPSHAQANVEELRGQNTPISQSETALTNPVPFWKDVKTIIIVLEAVVIVGLTIALIFK